MSFNDGKPKIVGGSFEDIAALLEPRPGNLRMRYGEFARFADAWIERHSSQDRSPAQTGLVAAALDRLHHFSLRSISPAHSVGNVASRSSWVLSR